jgi:hypothetical protein
MFTRGYLWGFGAASLVHAFGIGFFGVSAAAAEKGMFVIAGLCFAVAIIGSCAAAARDA